MIEKLIKLAAQDNTVAERLVINAKEIQDSPFVDDFKREQIAILEEAENQLPKLAYQLGMSLPELDNFLDNELAKTAVDWKSFGHEMSGHAKDTGKSVLLNALSHIGTDAVNKLYHSAIDKTTEGRNYKRMIEENPDLLETLPEDKMKKFFKTLHNVAGPKLSGDPLVAGSFIRNNMIYGDYNKGLDMKQVDQLIQARNLLDRSTDSMKAPQSFSASDFQRKREHADDLNAKKEQFEMGYDQKELDFLHRLKGETVDRNLALREDSRKARDSKQKGQVSRLQFEKLREELAELRQNNPKHPDFIPDRSKGHRGKGHP